MIKRPEVNMAQLRNNKEKVSLETIDENAELKRLWNVQLELLDVIDDVCQRNKINYSLYAGSLLGAVRNHGFIPWDDDLDICMSRSDYERFINVWKNEEHPGYILQNKDNTPLFTQSFTKIRKDHTAFLQYEWEKSRYHTGIFVDIFPIDRIPDGSLKRKKFFWGCMKYQLYTREFVPPKGSTVIKFISEIFLKSTTPNGRSAYRKRFEERLISYSNHSKWNTVAIETMQTAQQILPADLLDTYTRFEFEHRQYQCFSKWHEYLSFKYGDYMKLPPENERVWKHHPLIIDYDHNYEDLIHE